MNHISPLLLLSLICAPLLAADPSPKDAVTAAARKLGEQANYSWKSTVVVPEGSQYRPGPTEGKTEKGGYTHVTATMGENRTEAVMKGEKALVLSEGDWKLASEIDSGQGRGRGLARLVQNFKAPAAQAADLANATKEIKQEGESFAGVLTEDGAKTQFRMGNAKNASGSIKFWVKDGTLTKYEVKVKATVERNGNETEVDRATTVEIKDVGTTKVEVAEGAKKKLS